MRVIDRLNQYLEVKGVSAYAFERACGVANGYLGKQLKGKGSIGSDILEKVWQKYPDLNLAWLITGNGKMLVRRPYKIADENEGSQVEEDEKVYAVRNKLIEVLKEQLEVLSAAMPPAKKKKPRKK